MIRLILIQLAMTVIAIASGIGSAILGSDAAYGEMTQYYIRQEGNLEQIGIPLNVDTGYDGGAIGLGIISAICFLCVVWIEITKFKVKR